MNINCLFTCVSNDNKQINRLFRMYVSVCCVCICSNLCYVMPSTCVCVTYIHKDIVGPDENASPGDAGEREGLTRDGTRSLRANRIIH